MSEPDSPRRISKRILVLGFVLVLVLAYFGGAYFLLPGWVERTLADFVEGETGRRPTMTAVGFDPFRLRLKVEGFELPDPESATVPLAFDRVELDARALGFLKADVALEEVLIAGLRVAATYEESGELNWTRILASGTASEEEALPTAEETEPGEPLIVEVDRIRLEEGAMTFRDERQAPAFEAQVYPLALTVDGLTTRAGTASPYDLDLRLGEDTVLHWSGRFGLDPLQSEGSLALEKFDLRVPWDFLSDQLNFEVAQGQLDFSTDYRLTSAEEGSEGVSIALSSGAFAIRALEIMDPADGERVISLPSVKTEGIAAAVTPVGLETLDIETVRVEGGRVATRLEPSGALHLAELFAPAAASEDASADHAPAVESDSSAGVEPKIKVGQIRVSDLAFEFEDQTHAEPARLEFDPISLELDGFSSEAGSSMALTLDVGVGEKGRLTATGPVVLDPLSVALATELSTVALSDFQAYLDGVARLEIPGGALSAKLDLELKDAGGSDLSVRVAGNASIDDLLTVDQKVGKRFLEWKRLNVQGLLLEQGGAADSVAIEEIQLAGVRTHLILDAKGGTNLDTILVTPEGEGATAGASGSGADKGKSSTIRIGRVSLDDVGADFKDQSTSPAFVIALDQVKGTIEGLSSETGARAKVALTGRIDRSAPVEISGQINPLAGEAYTDLTAKVTGVSMPAFSPYAGRFVGRRIDRGKLGLDLHYKLNANRLEGKNLIHLERFAFGDRVTSKEATTLPVALAVSVLRDRKGNIDLPLPIKGNLDDPKFNVFRLLGKTFVNVITRVATSPLSVVAGVASAATGGSAKDLANVHFASGQAVLSDAERAELEQVVQVLVDRPGLRLEIRGRADPVIDAVGSRATQIEDEIRVAAYRALPRKERLAVGDPEGYRLSPQERLAELEKRVVETLGGLPAALAVEEASEVETSETERATRRGDALLAALVAASKDAGGGGAEIVDWRALANTRAQAIQDALLSAQQIDAARVYLVEPEVGAVGDQTGVGSVLLVRAK